MTDDLRKILDDNKNKRVCVLGTTCCGKSTLINDLGIGLDMDEEIFPLMSSEEEEYVCSDPWTEEIGRFMDKLVRERLSISPGIPMFGTVLLPCDLIVFLHVDDEVLKNRCDKRGVNFDNAVLMQERIEEEIRDSNISYIRLEVSNNKIK